MNTQTTNTQNVRSIHSNRRPSLIPQSVDELNDVVARHVIIERSEMFDKAPGTKRWICTGCRFASDEGVQALNHQGWIRDRLIEDMEKARVSTTMPSTVSVAS